MSLINYLTRIHFADGVLEEALSAETSALGIRRPLVVSDERVVECGLVEQLLDALQAPIVPVLYSRSPQDCGEAACDRATQVYKQNGCDGIIGFGGGTVIDLAKATALLASHGGHISDYMATDGGTARIRDILPPLIAVPTTAGAGSEVGLAAIVTTRLGRAAGLVSPHLVPDAAIYDPTLTLGLPADITAGAGMDALSHCIEAYVSITYNPPADGIAIDGLRRASRNLERAVNDGHDLSARREMMAAAMNGTLALQKGLGGVHAMSHALGGVHRSGFHHGKVNAVLLPHVLEFNAPAVGERYDGLRNAMGIARSSDLADAISVLRGRIGLPSRLSAFGIDAHAVEKAAPLAEKDHTNSTNPRLAGASDYKRMMTAAL